MFGVNLTRPWSLTVAVTVPGRMAGEWAHSRAR